MKGGMGDQIDSSKSKSMGIKKTKVLSNSVLICLSIFLTKITYLRVPPGSFFLALAQV